MADIPELQRQFGEIAAREHQRAVDEDIARRAKLVSSMYDEARRYTNIIITLGFAAYFTMLGAFRADVSVLTATGSACLVILSLLIFVGFEVYKIVFTGILFRRYQAALKPGTTLDGLKAIEEVNQASVKTFMRVWSIIIGPCVASGFGGALWLGGGIVYKFFDDLGVFAAVAEFFVK